MNGGTIRQHASTQLPAPRTHHQKRGKSVKMSFLRDAANALLNVLPLPLVFLYFIEAFVLAFPDTAYMDLIDNTLSMSQANQSMFYATIMIPWYFKPFYGWIVSRGSQVHGYRIRRCVVIASIGSAIAYFVTSVAVRNESQLYAATSLRALSNAFSELCLGVALVEISRMSKVAIGSLQSVATGSRAAGSLVAYLVSLPLYPCRNQGRDGGVLSSRSIIGMNSGFCLLGMIIAMYIPNFSTSCIDEKKDLNHVSMSRNVAILALSVIMGFGVFWIAETQQKSALYVNTPSAVWYTSAGAAMFIFIIISGWLLRRPDWVVVDMDDMDEEDSKLEDEGEEEKDTATTTTTTTLTSTVLPAFFFFAYNFTPNAETQWSNFQYEIFSKTKICNYQYLSIISMSSSLLGSALYGYLCGKRSTPRIIVVATCLSVLVGILRMPMAYHANNFIDTENSCLNVSLFRSMANLIGGDCVDTAFLYLSVYSLIEGILSQFVAVSLVVLAVERCPVSRSSGIWYGVFLSCLELGNSVGGWITAPIVSALNITYTDFSRLSDLIWIESATKIVILILVPFLLIQGKKKGGYMKNEEDETRDATPSLRELEAPLLSHP